MNFLNTSIDNPWEFQWNSCFVFTIYRVRGASTVVYQLQPNSSSVAATQCKSNCHQERTEKLFSLPLMSTYQHECNQRRIRESALWTLHHAKAAAALVCCCNVQLSAGNSSFEQLQGDISSPKSAIVVPLFDHRSNLVLRLERCWFCGPVNGEI